LSDERILRAVIANLDEMLGEDLASGALVVESLGGAGKLGYRLSQYSSGVCGVFVLMDDDASGRAAVQAMLDDGLLLPLDYRLTTARGKREAELEDLIDPALYVQRVNAEFGLRLTSAGVRRGSVKWSQRLATLFAEGGKLWTAQAAKQVKTIVADAVEVDPSNAPLTPAGLFADIASDLRIRLHGGCPS
jgi:hypothetical protein